MKNLIHVDPELYDWKILASGYLQLNKQKNE